MKTIMTTVVGDILYSKGKLDEVNRGLRQEVGESKDLRDKLEMFGAGVFREGSALGMRLDNMERECRAFGERVDMNITSMGNFEVETGQPWNMNPRKHKME